MTHKLIKTDNYLLVVTDDEIKKGDYIYDYSQLGKIYKAHNNYSKKDVDIYWVGKIASHLPLNGSAVLEGVDLLPAREDDVYKDLFFYKLVMNPYPSGEYAHTAYEEGFKDGYKKAVEKYKYTEEDIEAAVAFGMSLERFKDDEQKLSDDDEFKGFIQSLHQYPTEFETVDEYPVITDDDYFLKEEKSIPKPKTTTINGRRTWVGKYK